MYPAQPLAALLAGMHAAERPMTLRVSGLAADSRQVRPGELFCALAGGRAHGLAHLAEALARGAVAVAYEPTPTVAVPPDCAVPLLAVPGLSACLGEIAARFHGQPARRLGIVGVTGTNGKTSCTQFLAQSLEPEGQAGVIGTLGYGVPGALQPTAHTTPDPLSLQRMLAELRPQVRSVALEVSSHALVQERLGGLAVEGAVFTNLTRDHLDYHGDMAAYAAAKRRLFTRPELRWLVSNTDDAYGRELLALRPDLPRIGYGATAIDLPGVMALHLRRFHPLPEGGAVLTVQTPWGATEFTTSLLGQFNAQNLLAVLGALLLRGIDLGTAVARLTQLQPVAGRLERFGGAEGLPLVVVDYAHTPDALSQALTALRHSCQGRLYCVFGCGGERDAGKRPLMGAVAESLSDALILTDDNPRREDGAAIVRDILGGVQRPGAARVIRDRRQAIQTALEAAAPGDRVLIAGKGHETVQIIGAQQLPFSDREVVLAGLRQRRAALCSA